MALGQPSKKTCQHCPDLLAAAELSILLGEERSPISPQFGFAVRGSWKMFLRKTRKAGAAAKKATRAPAFRVFGNAGGQSGITCGWERGTASVPA